MGNEIGFAVEAGELRVVERLVSSCTATWLTLQCRSTRIAGNKRLCLKITFENLS